MPADAEGQVVAHDRDRLRQQPHEDCTEDRAVQRAEAADEDDGDELDGQQDVERIWREVADVMGEHRAGEAGDAAPRRRRRWILYSARLMPMLCAEISLSRIATRARPSGERRMFTATHSTKTSTSSADVVGAEHAFRA